MLRLILRKGGGARESAGPFRESSTNEAPNFRLPARRGNSFREKEMNVIEKIEREQMRLDIPAFKPGDAVKVFFRIVEGEKERIQVFQGNVIRMHRGTVGATVTVRKVSDGVGVERIFPLHSPFIDHIERVTEGSVRRSRLYYLRNLKGKAARIKPKKRY